jgi:hypothetical protein
MKALQAYIKFAGDFPITKVLFKIKNRAKIAERFVEKSNIKTTPQIVDKKLENEIIQDSSKSETIKPEQALLFEDPEEIEEEVNQAEEPTEVLEEDYFADQEDEEDEEDESGKFNNIENEKKPEDKEDSIGEKPKKRSSFY